MNEQYENNIIDFGEDAPIQEVRVIEKSEEIGLSPIEKITSSKTSLRSFSVGTDNERKRAMKIMSQPSIQLVDEINCEIDIVDFAIEIIDVQNKETGEIEKKTRFVFVDTEGRTHSTCSRGIYNSFCNLFPLMGNPIISGAGADLRLTEEERRINRERWNKGMRVKVTQSPTSNGYKCLTLSACEEQPWTD